MTGTERFFRYVTNLLYTFAAISLFAISLAMISYAMWEIALAVKEGDSVIDHMLDAVGLIVIAIAVFDVSKYLLEEEVLRNRELRSASEARRTLTKFLVIITIAVSLEALVFIFGAGKEDMQTLLYPTILLAVSVLLVVGLGLYQRLSVDQEQSADNADDRRNGDRQ